MSGSAPTRSHLGLVFRTTRSGECRFQQATCVIGATRPNLIQLFVVMLDYPLHASAVRQAQVRQLGAFVEEITRNRHPTVVCGDFNAGPDSDEMGMLKGRTDTAAPGLVFYGVDLLVPRRGPGRAEAQVRCQIRDRATDSFRGVNSLRG
jgi:hypothetical protein